MTQNTSLRIYVIVFLLVIVWGLSWPVCKLGLDYMPHVWFAALRLLIGMLSIFMIVALAGKFVIHDRRDLPMIFIMGILQMALFIALITAGLHYVSAGRSAMLVYTTPIWVMPLAILFFHEKFTAYKAAGFLLGMLGIIILFGPWGIDWSDADAVLGNSMLLLAAFCWAISILCARNMQWYRTPLELLPWQLLVATLPVFVMAFLHEPGAMIQWNPALIASLLFTGIFGTAFGYWGTLVVSKELPSITVSLCYLAVPVAALVFSALLLHEEITSIIMLAMLFILSGIACVAWGNTAH